IQVLAADGAESPALLPAETLHGDRHHELLPDEGAQIDPVVLKKLYLVVLIGDRLHPFGHPALFLVPVAAARPGDELLLKVGLHLGRVGAEAAAAEQGDGNGDPPLHQDAIPGAGRPTLNVDRPAAGLHANLGQIWRAGLIGDEDLCPAPLPQQPADLQLHGRSPPHYTGFPSTPSRETPEHPAPVWRPPGAHKKGDAATAHERTERRRARPVTSPSHTLPSRRVAYATAAGAVLFTAMVVLFPRSAFEASLDGLRLWFEVVLPSLLPFFVMAQVLMGLGAVHFLGVCLEPLMRPLFRLPGTAAFAVAMGLVSGYPLGAKVTGDLRRHRLCSREEAERLDAFANTADPIFMSGAVAVGMFGQASLGAVLSFAHYASVVLVGLLMRFHGHREPPPPAPPPGALLDRALEALYQARARDGRPFGHLLGDVVRDSMIQMLFIGGTIMLFSVLLRVAAITGLVPWAAQHLLGPLLSLVGLDPSLAHALAAGLF